MIEIRKDYILDRWSYIALDRENRLKQFKENETAEASGMCFFCPGNENMTPPEIGRIANDGSWKIRWFANKFPIAEESKNAGIDYSDKFFTKGKAFGYHEVITESQSHDKQLWDFDCDELAELFKVYEKRVSELSKKENIKYVQLFKNNGSEAGTSLVHTHTQIVATSIVPRNVEEKVNAVKKYPKCPYCEIIEKETDSDRFIYSNDDFIVFASFAPRFNYEAYIFPKKHLANMSEMKDTMYKNLAVAFKKILSKLKTINAPYNFYMHYSPKGEDLHLHFEITPRLNKWAGFELATGSYVITTSPENAAAFYKKN